MGKNLEVEDVSTNCVNREHVRGLITAVGADVDRFATRGAHSARYP